MSDRIILKGLQVFARHGVLPEETRLGQRSPTWLWKH
jgi:dihydroneopterin aldolase